MNLIFTLIMDFMKLKEMEDKERKLMADLESAEEIKGEAAYMALGELSRTRSSVYWDIAKNVWDAPLAVAGSFELKGVPGGLLEICGTMSSLINVYLAWQTMFPSVSVHPSSSPSPKQSSAAS